MHKLIVMNDDTGHSAFLSDRTRKVVLQGVTFVRLDVGTAGVPVLVLRPAVSSQQRLLRVDYSAMPDDATETWEMATVRSVATEGAF